MLTEYFDKFSVDEYCFLTVSTANDSERILFFKRICQVTIFVIDCLFSGFTSLHQ